jgi:hypothetical protein
MAMEQNWGIVAVDEDKPTHARSWKLHIIYVSLSYGEISSKHFYQC